MTVGQFNEHLKPWKCGDELMRRLILIKFYVDDQEMLTNDELVSDAISLNSEVQVCAGCLYRMLGGPSSETVGCSLTQLELLYVVCVPDHVRTTSPGVWGAGPL